MMGGAEKEKSLCIKFNESYMICKKYSRKRWISVQETQLAIWLLISKNDSILVKIFHQALMLSFILERLIIVSGIRCQ